MAKRSHSKDISTKSLVQRAENTADAPRIYVNHAQFSITKNEIYIDLYRIEPNNASPMKADTSLIQRVIIPLGLGKGFATALANLINGFERNTGITIVNGREKNPEDTVEIWKEE